MLQRIVLIANATINAVVGLGLIFAANSLLGLYGGMSMEPATDQLLGGALVGIAVLNLLASGIQAPDARRAVFIANFVYNAIVVAVLVPALSGVGNGPAWVTVVLAAITALAFGYLAIGALRPANTDR